MPMDLKEAAFALNTSREMLLRWARQGAIPAVEKNGEYQFDEKSLVAWAERRRMPVRLNRAAPQTKREARWDTIAEAMRRGGVYFGITGDNVNETLENAVAAIELPADIDKGELVTRLLEREALASTGIGHGAAIPHPRHPVQHVPEGGIICTCVLERPIDYRSVDRKPVFVLFIILSPGTKRHLEMLARLTFCLHDGSFLPALTSCDSPEHFLDLVQQVEEKYRRPSR